MWQGYGTNYYPSAPRGGDGGIQGALGIGNNAMANPQMGGAGGGQSGFGFNMGTFNTALGALGTGFGIYNAFQANKMAKQQFNFSKEITNTNLNNNMKSYNTALEDRIRSRVVMEGRPQGDADAYLNEHKLTR